MRLFLGGDVMPGRGVDQILPHPGDPTLYERSIRDARRYVVLAEAANGPIPWPVDYSWPWGDALDILDDFDPDVRLVNLETSITRSDDFAWGKGIHYRMSPDNAPILTAGRLDICSLANNHVMDFGVSGLEETLDVLSQAEIAVAGAGRAPLKPAVARRVVVFSFGTTSSGVPASWEATEDRPGVAILPDLSDRTADAIAERASPGDVTIVSLHWGSNWGYEVSPRQVRFAHRLIDGGIDLVHGHSSHHPRPIEIYRDRLILYGCGDLIDDYEGIRGYERYRDDLRLLYLVTMSDGRLTSLQLAPMQAHRMRLRLAGAEDREWLCRTLNETGPTHFTEDGFLKTT